MRPALGCLLFAGCIFQDAPLSGKSCPCASGFVCDEAQDLCVRMLDASDGGDAGLPSADAATDASAPDAVVYAGCARDLECASGEICVDSECKSGCMTTGCDGTDVCDPSGRCFSLQATCAVATECNPPDQVCLDGECVPGCAVGAGSCTENRICDTGTGRCVAAPTCSASVPCPDRDFACSGATCVRRCEVPGASPCLGNTSCEAGRCTGPSLGESCSGDAECSTGLCDFTIARPLSFCAAPCGGTSDCPIGFSCLPTGDGYRVCAPEELVTGASFVTPSGESCSDPDNTCQSTSCDPSTMTCRERCARNSDCAAFSTDCTLSNGTTECAPGPGTVAVPQSCSVNSDCTSGICNKYDSKCARPCCTDGDCASDENCLLYDLDNQNTITICRPRGAGTTSLGMACTNGSECESGTCVPASPTALGGPKICSLRCCTHADCASLNGYCHPIPGLLPGTEASTCFPP